MQHYKKVARRRHVELRRLDWHQHFVDRSDRTVKIFSVQPGRCVYHQSVILVLRFTRQIVLPVKTAHRRQFGRAQRQPLERGFLPVEIPQ
jgi:hypothetical protein